MNRLKSIDLGRPFFDYYLSVNMNIEVHFTNNINNKTIKSMTRK